MVFGAGDHGDDCDMNFTYSLCRDRGDRILNDSFQAVKGRGRLDVHLLCMLPFL